MPRKLTFRKLTFMTACFLGLVFTGCNPQEQKPISKEIPAIPVIATSPTVRDITVYLESIGSLLPSIFMEIRPQTSGILTNVLVNEGQMVKEGDPLFKINAQSYEIRVQEAEAQLAIDEAGLKAVQKKMSRYKDLAERDLVAKTEWDELKAHLQKSQAAVQLDNARVKYAKLELDHCLLYSPIDGRVGKLNAAKGFLVAVGQTTPLATISKMDPLIVEFTITEKEFPYLPKDGISINVQSLCSAGIQECSNGEVTFVDNHFNSATGLLLIRGKIDNPNGTLKPGLSVKVQLPIELTTDAKLIPQKAIRYNQEGPYVYVINEDSTVAIRQLLLGKEYETDQIILEGLHPEEKIILEGHLRLSPGVKVEVKS